MEEVKEVVVGEEVEKVWRRRCKVRGARPARRRRATRRVRSQRCRLAATRPVGGGWMRCYSFEGALRRTARHPPGVEGGFASSLRRSEAGCPAPWGDAALSIEAALQVCRRALRLQRHRVCKHACAFRELALTLTLTLTTNPNQRRRAGPDGSAAVIER